METSEQPPRTPRANPRPHRATTNRDRDDCAIRRHKKIRPHPTRAVDEEELGRRVTDITSVSNRPLLARGEEGPSGQPPTGTGAAALRLNGRWQGAP
jgi:hypothetical protein